MPEIGKILIAAGILLLALGLLLLLSDKIPFLGKLPGDIFIKKGKFTIYFPIVTCIILSIVITLLINLFKK